MILDLQTLERWLWDSADIFGLLFLKRVNDVYEEEVEKTMETNFPASPIFHLMEK